VRKILRRCDKIVEKKSKVELLLTTVGQLIGTMEISKYQESKCKNLNLPNYVGNLEST